METEKDDDRALAGAALGVWRNTRGAGGLPDVMQVAAWLEGKLDEAGAAEVERMLAADPMLLEALLAAREPGQAAVTGREVEAARGLVKLPWWQRRLPMGGLQVRWGPAFAATALVLTLGAGAFELGEAIAGYSLMQQTGAARAMLGDELFSTFGEK